MVFIFEGMVLTLSGPSLRRCGDSPFAVAGTVPATLSEPSFIRFYGQAQIFLQICKNPAIFIKYVVYW